MRLRFLIISFFLLILFLIIILPPTLLFSQFIPDEAIELKIKGDKARDLNETVDFYEKALKIHPDFPEVLYNLGLIYDKDFKDTVNAIYYYRRYLELEPRGTNSSEVLYLLKDAERRLEEKKSELGLTEIDKIRGTRRIRRVEPPASTEKPKPPVPEPSAPATPSQITISAQKGDDQVITITINKKIHKYSLKLDVWEREGFIEQFNKLGEARYSPLEYDIAGAREALRRDRARVTEFINYTDEGINVLLKEAVLRGIAYWGIELDHFPAGLKAEEYVNSYRVIETKEDNKFIDLTLEVSLNINAIYYALSAREYIFQPNRITIILQGVQGSLSEVLIEKIITHSDYTGPTTSGLYPIYTSFQNFAKEIEKIKIGKYSFYPISIGSNSITIQVFMDG